MSLFPINICTLHLMQQQCNYLATVTNGVTRRNKDNSKSNLNLDLTKIHSC